MSTFIAEPLSRYKIRIIIDHIRKVLGLENEAYIPIVKFLEGMEEIFEEDNFTVEIIPDNELPESVQGDTDVINNVIRIKESVYDGACDNDGTHRFSIAHEIGHYFLMSVLGLKFQRNLNQREIKIYEDPEWQANCFAGELLMPHDFIKGMSIEKIMDECKVSKSAACKQYKHIRH